jgi:Domain of unknown function (DUF4907)
MFIVLGLLFVSCNNSTKTELDVIDSKGKGSLAGDSLHYSITLIKNNDSTFGYQINKNKDVFIIQESIPTLSGNKGFKDSLKAIKCGTVVVNKLLKGVFPPTITNEELKSILK